MDQQDNAPRHDHAYDDNRDNRVSQPQQAPNGRRDNKPDSKPERGPSMIAYSVKDRGQDQDAIWRSVGAAFPHRDGKGMDVVLDALPTDGRVTLREQRREEFKQQRKAGQDHTQDRAHDRNQGNAQEGGQSRPQNRGPSRDM